MMVFGSPSSARMALALACTSGEAANSLHLLDVDGDRERLGPHRAALPLHDAAPHAGAQQMSGQLDEVLRAEWPLETNQVGTEQTLENFRPAG